MSFLKSLIFADSGDEKEKKVDTPEAGRKTFKSKFPSSEPIEDTPKAAAFKSSFPTTSKVEAITPDNPSCGPHLDKIMAMYEKGFDNLNQDGYDFYEYFKAVVQVGVNNPEMYKMAFTMAKTMEPNVSKTSLIDQSKFYVNEITTVHKHYVQTGESKRTEMLRLKGSEESTLQQEVLDIGAEIQRLTSLKSQKEGELSTIDSKYASEITDIECKLMANDMARDSIVGSINKVVKGINDNI